MNKLLNNYHSHFLSKNFFQKNNIIENHYNCLVNILEKKFLFKFAKADLAYLKDIMLFNQKEFNNSLFFDLQKFISNLIFNKYQIPLMIENFESILNSFFKENYSKILFNFSQNFNLNKIKFDEQKDFLFLDNSFYYGWEILTIINFAFKNFDMNINFNLLINDYFLISFDNLYLRDNQKNWKIPLFYHQSNSFYYEENKINKIILFIKNKYPNIILKPLSIDNNIFKFNFLNQDYSLLIDNNITLNLSHFKKIFLIECNQVLDQHLEMNINLVIKMLMFNKVYTSILIIDFFSKQKFYSLKSFLNFFQNFLIKKFKINWIDFELKNAFINQKFFQKNILLIHRMVPTNNIELPIILIYLKNPLFFSKRNPIHFIFILVTNTLDKYNWIISYLKIIQNNLKTEIKTIKHLYRVLSDFRC